MGIVHVENEVKNVIDSFGCETAFDFLLKPIIDALPLNHKRKAWGKNDTLPCGVRPHIIQ